LENLRNWMFMQTEQSVVILHDELAKISNLDSKRSEALSSENYVVALEQKWRVSALTALPAF
jgi:hypothetical protein